MSDPSITSQWGDTTRVQQTLLYLLAQRARDSPPQMATSLVEATQARLSPTPTQQAVQEGIQILLQAGCIQLWNEQTYELTPVGRDILVAHYLRLKSVVEDDGSGAEQGFVRCPSCETSVLELGEDDTGAIIATPCGCSVARSGSPVTEAVSEALQRTVDEDVRHYLRQALYLSLSGVDDE